MALLDLEKNFDLDVEAIDSLVELDRELNLAGVELWLAQPHGGTRDMLDRSGLTERIGQDHIFPTIGEAATAFSASIKREPEEAR